MTAMSMVDNTDVFDPYLMKMAGVYVSFQPYASPTTNLLATRLVKSLSKDAETFDQEEVTNICLLGRFKQFLSCGGDPGTLTVNSYWDSRVGAVQPSASTVTSYARCGEGRLFLARVTDAGNGTFTRWTFFACDANIQSCNTLEGEAGKSIGTTIVFKLTGEPVYYEDSWDDSSSS